MEKVFYSKNQGQGIIFENDENIYDHLTKQGTLLAAEYLKPGMKTTVSGFLKDEVTYLGWIKTMPAKLVFLLGEHENKKYCIVINKITITRIFIKYNDLSGTDYRFKDNNWN